ncbi:MAG: IPT/TIG domain-containing protein, partial [Actinomycetota bacterium]
VRFNGLSVGAGNFTVNSSILITATVPAGATNGLITVVAPGGTVNSATSFTVTSPPPLPTVTSLSPTTGPVGTTVTITGTNFTGATAVKFHGVQAVFTLNSDTTITATVPSGATTGLVAVVTPTGTGKSPKNFIVT